MAPLGADDREFVEVLSVPGGSSSAFGSTDSFGAVPMSFVGLACRSESLSASVDGRLVSLLLVG